MDLVGEIYRVTERLPKAERFGLFSQIRRAAVSVPSNIAEGAARGSRMELRRFLSIAQSSLSELDTQLDICVMLGFLPREERGQVDKVAVQVDKMLYALRESTSAE